jgi:SAM-dependent methyltransferase
MIENATTEVAEMNECAGGFGLGGDGIESRKRLPRKLSDVWKAPLHDFPVRDEILSQFCGFAPQMDVLEIGPGSGYTAFRLAGRIRRLALVDVAETAVSVLKKQLSGLPGLEFGCGDATKDSFGDEYEGKFDLTFNLDVFQAIPDPAAAFKNLARVLREGGEMFVTYPNVPPPRGECIAYLSTLDELAGLLRAAGFRSWEVFKVRPNRYAGLVYRVMHDWPLDIYRKMRSGGGRTLNQTYESTWAFQHQNQLGRYKAVLHLYWAFLGLLLRLGGDMFVTEPIEDSILNRQLVIRAWK